MKYEDTFDVIKEGEIKINGGMEISSNYYKKEQELQNHIINNIEKFTHEFLEDKLVSYEAEKRVDKYRLRGKRIDLFIKGIKKEYIIEFKNPKYKCENIQAIGQILDYKRKLDRFSDSKKEMIIITTLFDFDTARTIKYYNLPIRYIFVDEKHFMEYLDEE